MYVLITGGFDPIHSGHLNAFNKAARLGKLVVGLNSDSWLIRKKGAFLLPQSERRDVIQNLKWYITSWMIGTMMMVRHVKQYLSLEMSIGIEESL